MRAYKVCRVTTTEYDCLSDMEIKICAAESKEAAKAKFDGNGFKVVKVVDVTDMYKLNPSVIADALKKVRERDGYSVFDEWYIALLSSVIEQSYAHTNAPYVFEGEYW